MLRVTLARQADLALRVATQGMALSVIYRQACGGVVRAPLPSSGLNAGAPGVEGGIGALAGCGNSLLRA
jgi:hypothetical protein